MATDISSELTEFCQWFNTVCNLDHDTIKERRDEIASKRRSFSRFYTASRQRLKNDQDFAGQVSALRAQIKLITDIANDRKIRREAESERKSQSPEPDKESESMQKTQSSASLMSISSTGSLSAKKPACYMGKDCTSTDPKHFYEFIHFDHPKAAEMAEKYKKKLKKEERQRIYEEHVKKQSQQDLSNPTAVSSAASNEFGQFLTDEEIAQQLQAMEEMQNGNNDDTVSNTRTRRTRRQRNIVSYRSSANAHGEDQEDDNDDDDAKQASSSEEDDDDDDEDFDESEARKSHRGKIKRRKKEDERRKLEELAMDEAELEKLRKQRLDKLLSKTEAYMKTLTRRVRKNFRDTAKPKDTANGNSKNKNKNKNKKKKAANLSTDEVRDFLTADNTKFIEQTPSLIGGTLKDYQQVGLRWMVTLNQMRLNGILADEMGLGKTVQVLALLAYILDMDKIRGKHLIVVPLSTLSSWTDHFESWLPELKVYRHRGPANERKEKLIEIQTGKLEADVVISTYQMVTRDAETMSQIAWNYLIVDEAHTLKNAKGKLFEALNAFSTAHRLLLTGTPLQNNLGELWSLLNFILPSIFDSAQSFESWFCSPFQHLHGKKKKDEKSNQVDIPMTDEERLMVMDRLHRAIDPFLLRRMKKDVLPKLVKKEEIVIKVPISGMQSMIYRQLQKYEALRYKEDAKRTGFNNIMMQLRKCANHPYLFAPEEYEITEEIFRCSGKFVLLRHLIPKMKRFHHRMLVFCQFVQTMDILSEFLDFIDEPYLRIDGGTDSDDRIEHLSTFNLTSLDETNKNGETEQKRNKYSIFLLSTRACGLGLNLYSADTVILFDSDWNPQQDLQAMARCHRIGQKKEVRVFRLIADGTIEESIYDRAQKKLDLERKAIECGKFDFSISGQERKEFLQQILKQRTNVNNKYSSDIERTKLNQLLSRSEEEWKEFEKMDREQQHNEFKSLLTEEKLPEWLEEITTDKDKVQPLPAKRRRTKMSYNEDSYYKNIAAEVAGDDDEDDEDEEDKENVDKMKKKKKKNNRKRKRNEMSTTEKGDDVQNVEEEAEKLGVEEGDAKRRKIAN